MRFVVIGDVLVDADSEMVVTASSSPSVKIDGCLRAQGAELVVQVNSSGTFKVRFLFRNI